MMDQFDVYDWNPLAICLILLVLVVAWLFYYHKNKEKISVWTQAHEAKMVQLPLTRRILYMLAAMVGCVSFLIVGRLLQLPFILEVFVIIAICGIAAYDLIVIPFCSAYLDKLFDRFWPETQGSSSIFNLLFLAGYMTYFLVSRLFGVAIFCGMVMAVARLAQIILQTIK